MLLMVILRCETSKLSNIHSQQYLSSEIFAVLQNSLFMKYRIQLSCILFTMYHKS